MCQQQIRELVDGRFPISSLTLFLSENPPKPVLESEKIAEFGLFSTYLLVLACSANHGAHHGDGHRPMAILLRSKQKHVANCQLVAVDESCIVKSV